jgi:hypothetical protein
VNTAAMRFSDRPSPAHDGTHMTALSGYPGGW